MFSVIKDVTRVQNDYKELGRNKRLTKKNICDLIIPFRDKYRLKDLEALQIARDELPTQQIVSMIEKSLCVSFSMRRWFVERQKGNCIVSIMRNKSDGTYSFVNLTQGHICTCRFESVEQALEDMEKKKSDGSITDWYEL